VPYFGFGQCKIPNKFVSRFFNLLSVFGTQFLFKMFLVFGFSLRCRNSESDVKI
jgi:hypothetical protein